MLDLIRFRPNEGATAAKNSTTTTPLIRILTHPFTSQHTDTPTLIDLQ